MISHSQASHTFTQLFDNTTPFMAQDAGEYPLGVVATQGKSIGMADTCRDQFD